ncbi:hypothetical protein BCR39DRAFT_535572 [Naematelia encephala]|uniref:Uncharacterized protein n=1 Tax=Naematelia encephala TaxID=71784 RepID=A0A1Y2AZY9_9TREE|nr:hypothetical protein BCR39DRAFT_535572 [Naematelia encephala]
MLSRCTRGGPGPLTLAYRLGLTHNRSFSSTTANSSHSSSQHDTPRNTRQLRHRPPPTRYTAPSVQSQAEKTPSDRRRRPSKHRAATQTPRTPPSDIKPKSSGQDSVQQPSPQTSVVPESSTAEVTDEHQVIILPPPLDDPFTQTLLAKFRQCLEKSVDSDLDSVFQRAIAAFERLRACSALSLLNLEDYERISSLITSCFSKINTRDMRWFVANQSLVFGLTREMALHAAAHDHWRGLYTLLAALLAAGMPQDVPKAYVRCMEMMAVVQGRNPDDWHNPDRQRRIASRMESPALAPLAMVNITAHTALDTFDGTAIFSMLVGDLSRNQMLVKHYGDLTRGLPEDVKDRIQINVDKLYFSVRVYHGAALAAHLRSLPNHELHLIPELYNEMLKASIGPDRFLLPIDLENRNKKASIDVPVIQPVVWRAFMRGFEQLGRGDLIEAMIDTHLPERGVEPSARLLAWGMLFLARIYSFQRNSPVVRARAKTKILEWWDRFDSIKVPEGEADLVRALQLQSLAKLGNSNVVFAAYKSAKHGELSWSIGTFTMSSMIIHLIDRSRFDIALDVLKCGLDPTNLAFETPEKHNFSDFVLHLGSIRMPAVAKQPFMDKFFALLPDTYTLSPAAWARALAISVEAGDPIDTRWSLLENHLPRPGEEHHKYAWQEALLEILHRDHMGDLALCHFDIILRILERLSCLSELDLPKTRKQRIWGLAIFRAASSTQLSAAERGMMLDSIYELYGPLRSEDKVAWLVFRSIEGSLSVPNGEGLGQAKLRWAQLRALGHYTPHKHWLAMLKALLKDERLRQAAVDLVKDAWDSREISPKREFWNVARARGLIEEAGLVVKWTTWSQSQTSQGDIQEEALVEPEQEAEQDDEMPLLLDETPAEEYDELDVGEQGEEEEEKEADFSDLREVNPVSAVEDDGESMDAVDANLTETSLSP